MQLISVVLIICDIIYMMIKSRSLQNKPKISENGMQMLRKPVPGSYDFDY